MAIGFGAMAAMCIGKVIGYSPAADKTMCQAAGKIPDTVTNGYRAIGKAEGDGEVR